MQKSRLERSVIDLIPESFDVPRNKLETEEGFETVQNECKWIIDLMNLFPQMDDYEVFWGALRRISEEKKSSKGIAELVFYTLLRFFHTISSPRVILKKPAQAK